MSNETKNETMGALKMKMAVEYGIPEGLTEGLALYLVAHLQPGHFLTAVLSNNLREAIGRGDETSLAKLPNIVRFLYNVAPGNAWGSSQHVVEWLTERATAGAQV